MEETPFGVLRGFVLGYCWSGLPLRCRECWTGWAAWGVGGTWCCGLVPSLLYTLPESGPQRRGHQPSGVGNGISQRWKVSISRVLLSLLGTDPLLNGLCKMVLQWWYVSHSRALQAFSNQKQNSLADSFVFYNGNVPFCCSIGRPLRC